jgi:hypothetical protein
MIRRMASRIPKVVVLPWLCRLLHLHRLRNSGITNLSFAWLSLTWSYWRCRLLLAASGARVMDMPVVEPPKRLGSGALISVAS